MSKQASLIALALAATSTVAAQNATARVQNDAATVLSGHISLNGAPFDNAEVEFQPLQDMSEPPRKIRRVLTNPNGDYRIALDGSGRFVVSIAAAGRSRVTATRTVVEFEPGAREFSPNITAGTITLRLIDWDGSPATLSLERTDPTAWGNEVLQRASDNPYVLRGAAFGEYTVTAHASFAATEMRKIVLSPAQRDLTVELRLVRRHSTLTVRDTAGAEVAIPVGALRTSPGFALTSIGNMVDVGSVASGQPVWIHIPGYAPTCRLSPTGNVALTVTLEHGRTAYVANEDVSGFNRAELRGTLGADCGVPIASLGPHWNADRTALLVDDFPTRDGLTLVVDTTTRAINVAPDGRITFK
ncbi:MAG TPA: hypothetical protein VJN96_27310 [Vicinamibacterales bacterium]|nr:hypothetical protein [Vicinamibacterales bacterium]